MSDVRMQRRCGIGAGGRIRPSAGGARIVMALLLGLASVSPGCAPLGPNLASFAGDEPLLPAPAINPDLLKFLRPSNDRDWSPDQAVLATAEFHGGEVTVHNIRHITYRTFDDYDVAHYDKTYDLGALTSVDFVVVPFNDMPSVGHTMLSFGFEGREYLGVSVEIRKERGEKYGPLKGFFRQYELMYVVADEQDLLLRRVMLDRSDVYVYRTRATPDEARALFMDVMQRVNKLAAMPEFYETLTNNCTTNIRNHINHLLPGRVPYDYRVLLPGNSDRLAYDIGLLRSDASFEQARAGARINYLAYLYRDDPDFSAKIRH